MIQQAKCAPELLSPAGSPSALRAAVANGADAVYLGVENLNARRSAENFTLETLAEACSFAHLRGVRVYLTANVLVLPRETSEALDLIDRAWAAGVDAVIVQDLGLLRMIRLALPSVRVHASTQINTHASATLAVLGDLGVSRVTLAREVSVTEIERLAQVGRQLGVEVESFGHGALCVCYSGQCLMSSLVGGRSANRGMCAQPCRLPYELVNEQDAAYSTPGAHLLSPKDLASITVLAQLVEAGVSAVKIEGRMKSAEYVALVTGVYRAAIDRAVGQPDTFEVRDGEMAVLSEAFSRGFSEAYLVSERGNDLMSYVRPNNRGVLVGRLANIESTHATLQLDTALDEADTIEVWTSRGRFAQPVGSLTLDGRPIATAAAGMRVGIELAEAAGTGDRVFRVRNASLMDAAERSFRDIDSAMPIHLRAEVEMVLDQPLEIRFTDEQNRSGSALGSPVQRARTRPVSTEDVIEHVGRLGGTPYEIADWSVTLSPGAGIGFSELHRVRREALAEYESAVLGEWETREAACPAVPRTLMQPPVSGETVQPPVTRKAMQSHMPDRPARPARASATVVASVSGLEAARACLDAGADRVHVPAWELVGVEPLDGVIPLLPRIAHDHEVDAYLEVAKRYERVVAGTLGLLVESSKMTRTEAHWSLNALNAHSVVQLGELGADLVWLSPELSGRQVAEVTADSPVEVGLGVWGRQEVMVTEHCVLMSRGECSLQCGTCSRRTGVHFLKDRKGYRFPVLTDPTGRSHVYNSVSLDLTEALPDILEAGVTALRVDAETIGAAEAARAVAGLRDRVRTAQAGRTIGERAAGTTTGHFFRGVS